VQAGDEGVISEVFAEDATWTIQAGHLPISGAWTDGAPAWLAKVERT
jgi:hypothetical protein